MTSEDKLNGDRNKGTQPREYRYEQWPRKPNKPLDRQRKETVTVEGTQKTNKTTNQ